MKNYEVRLTNKALKELDKLPTQAVNRISAKTEQLSFNPRPKGCKKLQGEKNLYRIRIGKYRVIYSIFEDILLIEVIRIGHRKDVYK